MRKNMEIRLALFEAGMTQKDLARLLGLSQPAVCIALSNFEFSKEERNNIIRKIKAYGKEDKDAE